ncbi:MAG: type I-E CRISPR-associated protein Cse1/CasA [Hydrogenophilales bacterium]|nr:type I-E CRISPR-associated protein Cse1/CasA [Hydrogenophilales bacterium]
MNLLVDPIFRVRTSKGIGKHDLPGLMALLGEDKVESLPGLQRHQEDAFHVFLCYLAGAVLARSGASDPRQDADYWREGIRDLTRQEGCADDSAWTLVVADPTKPAFMQPPAPDKATFERDYKPKAATPDALDVMQTAKNHDVKSTRAIPTDQEAWLYALISLQTTIGFLGAGNQGISRMNGGFGSRPFVGWRGGRRFGPRFNRDAEALIAQRHTLLESPYPYRSGGKTLLWVGLWDGATSLSLNSLDPFYIEIARRIRIIRQPNGLIALGASCAKTRVAAKELSGNLGDPWIPINIKTNGALTVPESGLTTGMLRDLIFGDGNLKPAAMQAPETATGSGWLNAAVLVRGQGTTDGFHEATIRIPERARQTLFGGGIQRDRLAKLSKRGLDAAATIQFKALRPALFSLMEGGPESIVLDKTEVAKWVDSAAQPFGLNWNPLYFDWLWDTPDIPDEDAALRPWFEQLRTLAQDTLNRAMERAPLRGGRSYRAKTKAQGLFIGSLYKNFPQYMEVNHDHP